MKIHWTVLHVGKISLSFKILLSENYLTALTFQLAFLEKPSDT